MISDECYKLAGNLFGSWVFIDSARRYAAVEEKSKALTATVIARAAVYDAEGADAMTTSEAKALNDDLEEVIHTIQKGNFAEARDRLESLSEQVFMSSLDKVVECECAKR